MKGGLLGSSKEAWDLWWQSPMAHMWQASQWPQVQRLVALTDQTTRMLYQGEANGTILTELRHLENTLGISEEGRRKLRWRFAEEEAEAQLASVTPLASRARPDPRKKA